MVAKSSPKSPPSSKSPASAPRECAPTPPAGMPALSLDTPFEREVRDALSTLDDATEDILDATSNMLERGGWGEDIRYVVGPIVAAAVNARRTLACALNVYIDDRRTATLTPAGLAALDAEASS